MKTHSKIKPAFDKNNIPICFACDKGFHLYTSVAVQSVIENSICENNYDILILHENLDRATIDLIKKAETKNCSIRFFNINEYIKNIGLIIEDATDRSKIVYYRFFVPRIFCNYEHIIYLDSDLVCDNDISELYKISLNGMCIGAVRDIYMGILLLIRPNWNKYIKYTLGLENPENYFQSGVMIFDIKRMLTQGIEEQLLKRLKEIKEPLIVDQDIYNSVCQDKVSYINPRWNYDRNTELLLKECDKSDQRLKKKLTELEEARRSPNIIHYAGSMKPWNYPLINYADTWRYYAKKSPCYEELLIKHPQVGISRV